MNQYQRFLFHMASETREEKFEISSDNRKKSSICQFSKTGYFGNIRALYIIAGKRLFS